MANERIRKFFFPMEEEDPITPVETKAQPEVSLRMPLDDSVRTTRVASPYLNESSLTSTNATSSKQTQTSGTLLNTIVYNPSSFADAERISKDIIAKHSVIVNLEAMLGNEEKRAESQRLIDFLCGAAFALKIEIKRINQTTFLFAPGNSVYFEQQ